MYIQIHTVVLVLYARLFVVVRPSLPFFFFFLFLSLCLEAHTIVSLLVAHSLFIFFFWLGMAWLLCVQQPILRLTPTSLPPSSASHIVVHEMMQTTLKVLPFQKENKNKRKKAKQKMENDGQCFFLCVFVSNVSVLEGRGCEEFNTGLTCCEIESLIRFY